MRTEGVPRPSLRPYGRPITVLVLVVLLLASSTAAAAAKYWPDVSRWLLALGALLTTFVAAQVRSGRQARQHRADSRAIRRGSLRRTRRASVHLPKAENVDLGTLRVHPA